MRLRPSAPRAPKPPKKKAKPAPSVKPRGPKSNSSSVDLSSIQRNTSDVGSTGSGMVSTVALLVSDGGRSAGTGDSSGVGAADGSGGGATPAAGARLPHRGGEAHGPGANKKKKKKARLTHVEQNAFRDCTRKNGKRKSAGEAEVQVVNPVVKKFRLVARERPPTKAGKKRPPEKPIHQGRQDERTAVVAVHRRDVLGQVATKKRK